MAADLYTVLGMEGRQGSSYILHPVSIWSFPNLSDFYFVPRLVPACPMCPCSDERTTTFTLSLSLVTCFRTHNEDIEDIELEKDYQLAINLLPLC